MCITCKSRDRFTIVGCTRYGVLVAILEMEDEEVVVIQRNCNIMLYLGRISWWSIIKFAILVIVIEVSYDIPYSSHIFDNR